MTESILTAKFCHALSKILKVAQQEAHVLMQKMKTPRLPNNIAVAGEHRLYCTFDELAKYTEHELIQAFELDPHINIPQKIPQYIPLKEELSYLRKKFHCIRNGFNEFKGKYIKIAYEHIFGPDIKSGKKGKRLSGLHHDFMGYFEKTNFIELKNKIKHKFGYYKADLWWNGRLYRDKTFFPKEWPRAKVIEKIYEAYDEFIHDGANRIIRFQGSTYKIQGITKEGITIEMAVIKCGKITTAYPILK